MPLSSLAIYLHLMPDCATYAFAAVTRMLTLLVGLLFIFPLRHSLNTYGPNSSPPATLRSIVNTWPLFHHSLEISTRGIL